MIRIGTLLLVTIGLAVSIAVVSTGGVSSVTADRPADITVVDDSDAYLGIEQTTTETPNETVGEITVKNQFPTGTTIDGTIDSGRNATVDGTERQSFELEPGESTTVTVECERSVTINASGPGIETTTERTIECG